MKDAAVVAGPLLRRRALLPLAALLGAGGPALGRPAVPRPDPGPSEHLTLLVAGPPRGTVDRWAALLAPVLARSFPAGTVVGREAAGAADGVTGANQFETRTSPDGGTALLLPGAATQAWLVGDPRAQFDATRWVIALASVTPVVLASRIPLARIRPGARVRVAAAGPAGHDLPGLLAVELLGAEVVPVFGAGLDAVLRGEADATLLRGRGIMPAVQACTDAGAPPVLAFGSLSDPDPPLRDPVFAPLPILSEVIRPDAAGPLFDAWRVAATAAQVDTALALPKLTPAAMVALWRRACAQAAAAPELQQEAARLGLRTLAAPNVAAVAVDASALLDLRRWLAMRFDWRAG